MSNIIPSFDDNLPRFGTFPDGTPFATSRGLADMCGVDESTIRDIGQYIDIASAREGTRAFKIGKSLLMMQYTSNKLYEQIPYKGINVNAYPEPVCIAILKYYAYQAGNNCTEKADELSSLLMTKTFRDFVYELVGYKETRRSSFSDYVLSRILNHHDVDNNRLPDGYFCLFDKMIELLQKFDLSIGYILKDQWFDIDKNDTRFLEPDISLGIRFTQLFESDYREKQVKYDLIYQKRLKFKGTEKFWTKELINASWELEKAIAERDLRVKHLKIEGIDDPSLPIPKRLIPREEYNFNPAPDSKRDKNKLPPAYCYSNDYTSLFYEWLRDVFFKYVWRDYILERDPDGWMQKYNKFKSLPPEKQKAILQTAEGKMISGFEYRDLWEKQLPPGGEQ